MWRVIGALAGIFVGLVAAGALAALALGIAGGLAGWLLDRRALPGAHAAQARATAPPGTAAAGADDALLQRLAALEARLARIEAHVGLAPPPGARLGDVAGVADPEAAAADAVDRTLAPPVAERPDVPPPRPAYAVHAAGRAATDDVARVPPSAARADAFAPVRAWLAGGNALTRIGIVVLFFGVAFLLRHFAETFGLPIEAKLGGAAAGGLALAALGMRLARTRPAYGLSLQGGGMGIVYLTVFAAFRLYDVLAPLPAIALLAAVAAATIAVALRHDAQALAALAFAGGFLAPVLIQTADTRPLPLFAWFAVLDGAIFAVAWRRRWRALDVLGFAFTFALGLAWGWSYYRSAHYATVQPFLALFFLFYVGIAILHARRAGPQERAPVDGVLVFGVPLVGFALQSGIVARFEHGTAWSAGALAAFYAALWAWHRRAPSQGLARLAQSFAALALVFATLVLPLALDARWTSAGWAIEATAVYWLGLVQRQRVARWFALAVAAAAAAAFAWSWPAPSGVPFANAAFSGAALIGLAALAIVGLADRHPAEVGRVERWLLWIVFAWGLLWWVLAGTREFDRAFDRAGAVNASLAWVAGSAALALAAGRALRWPRIGWSAATVLPAMLAAAVLLFDAARTTLASGGWLAWPLAWAAHAAGLRAVGHDAWPARRLQWLGEAHVATALALVAWLGWEASEWVGRSTAEGTVWIACAAALPPLLYLAAVTRARAATAWPFGAHGDAWGRRAGAVIAVALAAWFVGVNVVSPGDPRPLPWLPLANPLDVTLAAALVAAWRWSAAWTALPASQRLWACALAAFVAGHGALARAAHHLGGVAWDADALFAYRPLQAAVTLSWTLAALGAMLLATRRALREVWLAGAALLALVVAKLFLLDLAALSGLTRVVAFLGVGALLLVIGYVAPLPPGRSASEAAEARR